VEINSNSPNAVNTSAIINVPDTMNDIHAMVEGIDSINNLPTNKPFDPVQFLTDSKKVLQGVNTAVKVLSLVLLHVPLDFGPLIALIPEVILDPLSFMHKT
jgi:hypothetical protein